MFPPVRDLRPDAPDIDIQKFSLRLRWMRWISDYLPVSPSQWTDEAIFHLLGEIKAEEPKPEVVPFNPLEYDD